MNFPVFIAKRLVKGNSETSFSKPINVIAVTGISLGLAVMILAVSILTGFKQQIREKVAGFGAHIQILNYDSNLSYETQPVNTKKEFVEVLKKMPGIDHLQVFATKAGIIKTVDNIQGVVLKGIGPDFDWSFFRSNMSEGSVFNVTDTSTTNSVVISKQLSSMLNLGIGDAFAMHFVQDPPRMRKFTISGIYETSLEEFDKVYIFCDIGHIRKLNGWDPDQASGIEVYIDNFDDLELMTWAVSDAVGYKVTEESDKLKVTNIRDKFPQIFDWLGFQDMNVVIIITLMLLVAGFNMISGLLILILEKTNMIGILKALGSSDNTIRKVFLLQAAYLIGTGLLWGNLTGIGLALIQLKTGLITLNPESYYIKTVPVNLDLLHVLLLNAGTMAVIIIMLIVPSQLVSRITPVKAIRFD
jgi:lipoprotein-releasing system permease protein